MVQFLRALSLNVVGAYAVRLLRELVLQKQDRVVRVPLLVDAL